MEIIGAKCVALRLKLVLRGQIIIGKLTKHCMSLVKK